MGTEGTYLYVVNRDEKWEKFSKILNESPWSTQYIYKYLENIIHMFELMGGRECV